MNIKEVASKVENFVPPTGFNGFFKEWKVEQGRIGFNWSIKSEEIFRTSMLTGMVFLKSLDGETQEAVQKREKVTSVKAPETSRVRSRQKNKEESPEKTTRTRNTVENVATIETGNRTRTRTRTSN